MAEDENQIKYQFTINEQKWTEWKDKKVPRSKKIDEAIIGLIEKDLRTKTDSDR